MYGGVLLFRQGGGYMKERPIKKVESLEDGVLRVTFETGNHVIVDMNSQFVGFRFGVLQHPEIWNSADTDGYFVYWYKNGCPAPVAELAFDEIMKITFGEFY